MGMVINTNVGSLNAQRALNASQNDMRTAMERLTSGKRINSAKDDAAGLSISNRMTSQIRGINQAVRNANDGISMIQTAEGALDETSNILQRMRELSIQSANGTFSSGNRQTINAEVKQLTAELDRIAKETEFNGLKLFDGSQKNVSLQVGAQANQTIDVKLAQMDAKSLGMGSTSADNMGDKNTLATSTTVLENNSITINGQSVMAIGESFTGGTDTMGDLIDKINTNVRGVTASTFTEATAETAGTGVLVGVAEALTVDLVNLDGTSTQFTVTDTENMQQVADKLNEAGGGLIAAQIVDGKLSVAAENVTSIKLTDAGTTLGLGTIDGAEQTAQISLTSDTGDDIVVERGSNGSTEDLAAFGFRENNKPGVIEGDEAAATGTLAAGDIIINGTRVGPADSAALQDTIAAINKVSSETGVRAVAFTSVEFDVSDRDGAAATDFTLNGVAITGDTDLSVVVANINAETQNTGITATLSGKFLRFEGDVSSIQYGDGAGGPDSGVDLLANIGTAAAVKSPTDHLGGVKLISEDNSPISLKLTQAGKDKTGLLEANATADGKFGAGVDSIDISTVAGAQKAIGILDKAIETVSNLRGDLGAASNRLDSTISNLSNVAENVSAARSRIQDADFAAESANLSRAQVLQQAGTAMLAQANAQPQSVLSLLQ